jgi:hypothetical protein
VSCPSITPLNNPYTFFKMKDRKAKQVLPGEWIPVGVENVNGEGRGG